MLNTKNLDGLYDLLKPYTVAIREAIAEGFRHRQSRYSDELCNHSPRTRASLTNDLIVEYAKRKLTPLGVKVFKKHNRVLFDIKGLAIIHFKKLNNKLLSSNIPTLFAQNFVGQLDLPGIPSSSPRLVAGFIPTRDWVSIEGMFITLPIGDEVNWSRSLGEQPLAMQSYEEKENENQQHTLRVRRKGGANSNSGTGTNG